MTGDLGRTPAEKSLDISLDAYRLRGQYRRGQTADAVYTYDERGVW
jgi:hypothetical protein